jgi:uncharacterized membrane protein YhaH (DUF805 family)
MGKAPAPQTVVGAALLPLRRYARYASRSSRMEFWSYTIAANALQTVLALLVGPISWILFILLFLPSIAVLVRRLHDVDRSGWWVLPMPVLGFLLLLLYGLTGIMFGDEDGKKIVIAICLTVPVTLALGITLLVWTCRCGMPGANRFGPPPHLTSR